MSIVLTMLGEAATTRFTRERDSKIFQGLRKDARDGGSVGGAARRDIERRLGKGVVSDNNYLKTPEKRKRLGNKERSKI